MNNNDKLLQLLGLSRRAKKLLTGEEIVLKAIRSNKVHLVFFANDGGNSSKKKFTDKTNFYNITLTTALNSDDIKKAIGIERTVIAVTDIGFSKKMKQYLSL